MAGRLRKCRYCRLLLVFMTVGFVSSLLISSHVWDPRPALSNFIANITKLSEPRPQWTVRADNAPDVVTVIGSRVIVAGRGFVTAYDKEGTRQWGWPAFWGTPVGDVVVARQRPENLDAHNDPDIGYQVFDPFSGAVLWRSPDAIAVWPYADMIIDLSCNENNGPCKLRFLSHRTGALLSDEPVALPAQAKTVRGLNPPLAGLRDPADWFGKAARGLPQNAPTVFALPLNGHILVVDTFRKQFVRDVAPPDRDTRISAAAERLLYVKAVRVPSGCRFSVDGVNYRTSKVEWHGDGFDLDTARGAGCEQREDPLGATGRLVVSGTDNKPMLIEADTYRNGQQPTWEGPPGAKVLAVSLGLTVIVAADGHTVSVIDFDRPGHPVVWTGLTGLDPQAAITDAFVIIRDTDAGKLLVLRRRPNMTVNLRLDTKSEVFGVGSDAIVLGNVRTIGYQPVSS